MTKEKAKVVTAAVLVIGNEILSGRTKDKNLAYLSEQLTELGINLREARVVADDEADIIEAVNTVRAKYDYVFTTGGIGPTHDDITADCIAKAFDLPIGPHPEAVALLEARYANTGLEFNQSRQRMARTPEGASLIENPVSTAPGFRVENVYVMAGIPVIAQAMFQSLKHELVGGDPVLSVAVNAYIGEGRLAPGLGRVQDRYPGVDIGSYPFHRDGIYGATLVCRSSDAAELGEAAAAVRALISDLGGEPEDVEEDG